MDGIEYVPEARGRPGRAWIAWLCEWIRKADEMRAAARERAETEEVLERLALTAPHVLSDIGFSHSAAGPPTGPQDWVADGMRVRVRHPAGAAVAEVSCSTRHPS